MISHVPDDLIIKVLSFLNVKSLMRFKSVSKSWNTLISDPAFIKLHLQHSPRNKHVALTIHTYNGDFRFITFPLNHLIENPSITIPGNLYNPLEEINDCSRIIGSCNGLLCLLCYSSVVEHPNAVEHKIWFRIWNPATNTVAKPLGYITCKLAGLRCTFGYDNSTETYKVVVLFPTHQVKILNLRDNSWKTISRFPPFHRVPLSYRLVNEGVYLSGTVNWFAIRSNLSFGYYLVERNNITVDQFVIISLDLSTETYMHLSPPHGVDEVPRVEPTIAVLMDCLCFCHDQGPRFVIWKMAEFGVEQSWTQFLKISYQSLHIRDWFSDLRYYHFFPFCLSRNGNTLILAAGHLNRAFFYNLRDNRVQLTSDLKIIWSLAKNYVESIVTWFAIRFGTWYEFGYAVRNL
ncbi:F-box/kelch-repeat protein [Trifolium repens]|nr:F-box/kelch-repeat protein [Trifolium repens]